MTIKSTLGLTLAVWAGFAPVLQLAAQENTGQPEVEEKLSKPRDYGPAFQKLIDLGVPDAKGGKYVKLIVGNTQDSGDAYENYYERQFPLGNKGNAWVLPEKNEPIGEGKNKVVPQTVIHNNYTKITVFNKERKHTLLRLITGPDKAAPKGVQQAEWKEVDIKEDVKRVLAALDKLEKKGSAFDGDQWRYNQGGLFAAAKVLVMACHIYRSGEKELGNQLADRILTLAPFPEKVIDLVVNKLADHEYDVLFKAFLKSRDWKAYHDGLVRLSKKYPRGWGQLYGVKMLMPKVENRMKGNQPKPREFPGVTPDPEAVKILNDLLERTTPIQIAPRPSWLVNDGSIRDDYGNSGTTEPWLEKIYKMGMNAIPALAAVAADDALIATTLGTSGRFSSSRIYGGEIESMASSAYQNMSRPCSRGEIVRSVLIATIPDSDSELARMEPEELQDMVIEWWKRNKNLSQGELAKLLMEAGNHRQRAIALQILVKSGKDEHAAIVEEYILSQDSVISSLNTAEVYLKARKGKAKEFFEKFSKAIRDEVVNEPEQSSYYMREAGGVDKLLKKLSVHVQNIKPEKILADVRSGKTKLMDVMPMLEAAMGDDDKTKLMPEVIALIAETKDIREKFDALQKVSSWIGGQYNYYDEAPDEEDAEAAKAQKKLLMASLEKTKVSWQKMLTSREPLVLPEEKTEQDSNNRPARKKDLAYYGNPPSVAHYVAWSMDSIYFPEHLRTMRRLSVMMSGDALWNFMLKRAEEILEKGDAAYYPDAGSVDEKRRQVIRDELAKLDVAAIISYKKKFTLDEKLAWPEIIAGYGDKLPKQFLELSSYCAAPDLSRVGTLDQSTITKMEQLISGKKISKELLDGVLKILAENAEKHPNFIVVIRTMRDPGEPLHVQIWNGDFGKTWKWQAISKHLPTLIEGKAKKLTGLYVYGLGEGGREGDAAVMYDPPIDAKAEAKAKEEMIKKLMEFFDTAQSKDNGDRPSQISMIMTVETAENAKEASDPRRALLGE